jgi:hypothetical protein
MNNQALRADCYFILDENALADVISLIAGKRSVSLILVKANKRDSGNSLA